MINSPFFSSLLYEIHVFLLFASCVSAREVFFFYISHHAKNKDGMGEKPSVYAGTDPACFIFQARFEGLHTVADN